jgi:hypothetical protein
VSWRDRFPEEVTCVRCLEVRETRDLDRLLWCERCREESRRRALILGYVAGFVLAGLLALWIWLVVQPSDLVLGGWIATVVATVWVGARVSREIIYGAMRFQNRRAAQATPPSSGPDESAE